MEALSRAAKDRTLNMNKIEKVGVIGAGQMGRGIAEVCAEAGLEVALLDADQTAAGKGKALIEKGLRRLVEKGKKEVAAVDAALGRIAVGVDYAMLSDSEMIIEAATERLELKLAIFEKIDSVASADAIFASNTSSISITKLAASLKRPDQMIGMHFMNPVPRMKLVEVIRALQTSDATYDAVVTLAEKLDKTCVSTKDMPGFIVNRLLIPFLNEACFALEANLGSVEDIDASITLGLNHPLGPFALADLIGLDTVLFIAEVLHREMGDDKYRPSVLLRNYVAAGWLGKKAGRGFYAY